MLLLTVALSACASEPSPSATVTGSTPGLQITDCGTATARGTDLVVSGAQALHCFVDALHACTAARVQLNTLGVDTGTEHHLTIIGGSPCHVTDVYSSFIAPHTPGPPMTDVCAGFATSGSTTVLLGCGIEGELMLPSAS